MAAEEQLCILCEKPVIDDGFTLTKRGLDTVLKFCALREDKRVEDHLTEHGLDVVMHNKCRKDFTNEKRLIKRTCEDNPDGATTSKLLRSTAQSFDWKGQCFLCCRPAIVNKRKPKSNDTFSVRTFGLQASVLEHAVSRQDSWGLEVQARINTCNDLVAVEAVYHHSCYCRFGRSQSLHPNCDNRANVGRPVNIDMHEAFDKMCNFIEKCDDKLMSLDELISLMQDFSSNPQEVYCKKAVKDKLVQRYGSHIEFNEVKGKMNVVCFKDMASTIINAKFYTDRGCSTADEHSRIVMAAAKLIKAEIREMSFSTSEYPTSEQLNSTSAAKDWIPSLLKTFMEQVVSDELKQVALCQAIVQAARPRSVIAPILFGVGVALDHEFGSKWLLTCLARLGFSSSYDEVNRFKQSAAQTIDDALPPPFPTCFTQWSGDNVDHTMSTVSGIDQFHGTGVVSMTVPSAAKVVEGSFCETPVRRLSRKKVTDIAFNSGIPMTSYSLKENNSSLCKLVYLPMSALSTPYVSPPSINLELVWHTGSLFVDADHPQPNWSGYMHDVSTSITEYPGAADIRMLPIMDANPNDRSTIFSVLTFIEKQAHILNMPVACITFDQLLWIKAVEIVKDENLKVCCRLGGFHTLMNFLGAIGFIMTGSGFAEGLQLCYGSVSVTHMMSGKAYAKSLRGHLLTESALSSLLHESVLSGVSAADDVVLQGFDNEDIQQLQTFYQNITDGTRTIDDPLPDIVQRLESELATYGVELANRSRTAKLWLKYVYYVGVVKNFIRAERTSDWNLHLVSVSQMLNLFAAAGHRNYAKSARLYLQLMMDLPVDYPWLYEQFSSGRSHSIRRCDRYWTALSTDLIIEQVMMRSVKARGGLTHGRGLTESVRNTWICSLGRCASIRSGVVSLTKLESSANDIGHVDSGDSRSKRDYTDLSKLLEYYRSSNPFFVGDGKLRSLHSGISATAGDGVNCDNAEEFGFSVMAKMDLQCYGTVKLKKCDRAKTLDQIVNVVVTDKKLKVDSNLLFSRMLIIVQRRDDIASIFSHELTAMPASMFKDGMLRKTAKSLLGKELKFSTSVSDILPSAQVKFVVDGGWLLHKIKWEPNKMYADIVQQYVTFVRKQFGAAAVIVFDGYGNGPTTKDHEHSRRSSSQSAPNISVENNKAAYNNAGAFFANEHNKVQFVALLTERLELDGHQVQSARDDADTLIVHKSLEFARNDMPVVTVANDTDILILLLYHFTHDMADIFLRSDTKASCTSTVSIRCIRQEIGDDVAKQLLMIHAVGGCDTTSALFGHSKVTIYRKITKSSAASSLTHVMDNKSADHTEIEIAGMQLFRIIYGFKSDESLNHHRYSSYMKMLATSTTQLKPERLPPTENAAKFHFYRVHLQVVQWHTLMDCHLNPQEWGWKLSGQKYLPIATDLPAAPDDVLKVVRCQCKEGEKWCRTSMCSCVKHGLDCVAACKNCDGELCHNTSSEASRCSDIENDDRTQSDFDGEILDDGIEFFMPWVSEVVIDSGCMDLSV